MAEPRINLLPLHMKAQLVKENRQRQFLFGLSALVVILFVTYGVVTWSAAMLWSETATLKQDYVELSGKIDQLRQYSVLQENIIRQEELIKQAVGADPDWSVILQNLVVNMPSDIWLAELILMDKTENVSEQSNDLSKQSIDKIAIYGYAYEYNIITDWSSQISQIPGLSKVNCSSTTKIDLNGDSVISFKIDALVTTS